MTEGSIASEYDVVVVGAGIGGLVCAARLQKAGFKVLLAEQHHRVGGYCTTFKRKGYEFEAAIHFIAGCEPGGMLYETLRACGAENRVNFIRLDPVVYKSVYPDRTLLIPPTIEAFKDLLRQEFPGDIGDLDRYFGEMERIFDLTVKLSDKSAGPLDKCRYVLTHALDMALLARNLNATFGTFLRRHIKNQQVREIVSQLWGFLGVPPDQLSLPFFIMAFMVYYKQGAYYIKGGSQALSDAIAAAFKDHGGTLKTSCDVEKIKVENGRVTGAVIREKHAKEARDIRARAVVSGADATHTFLDLVGADNLPRSYVNRLKQLKPAVSALCVYLGVDMDLPGAFQDDFDVFVGGSYDSEAEFAGMMARTNFNSLGIAFYSNVYPPFSPDPGKKHVISLITLMNLEEPRMRELWGTESIAGRGEKYRRIKEAYADKLIDQAEKILPGLKEHIEVKEIATPMTMKRYTRNLNGSILGWENCVEQSILRRMKPRTPIRNLFLASAWTFPGGGVNGVAMGGDLTADLVLKRLK